MTQEICLGCGGTGRRHRLGYMDQGLCEYCGGFGRVTTTVNEPEPDQSMVCKFCGTDFKTSFAGLFRVAIKICARWTYEAQACPSCAKDLEKALKSLIGRHEAGKRDRPEGERRIVL